MASFRKSLRRRATALRQAMESLFWPPMRPSAIVLGTQKGGTTALFKYLSQHPQIVPSKQKELNFFDSDAAYAKGIGFYHRYFERATPWRRGQITMDVTPAYLAAADRTEPRIHAYDPAVRLVALLRDPTVRAYSAWQMYRKRYRRDPRWFSRYLENRLGEKPGDAYVVRPVFGEDFRADLLLEIEQAEKGRLVEMPMLPQGMYAKHLSRFYEYFPREQLLVLESDEIRKDTTGALCRIERHIGLPPHDWSRADIAPHFEGGYRDKMTDAERDLLREYYAPHNQQLFALLGTTFNWS